MRQFLIFFVLAASVVLGGCATTAKEPAADSIPESSSAEAASSAKIVAQTGAPAESAGNESPAGDPNAPLPWEMEEEEETYDPFESWNRKVYAFNQVLDRNIFRPIAEVYQDVVPGVARTGIGNFFRNLLEPTNIINGLLQGKFAQAGSDTGRFIANSTFGLLGFVDVATDWGMPLSNEDFGQTLGVWGAGEGPYVVWPFFGPRTLRDSAGLVADWYTHPVTYVEDDLTRWGLWSVYFVDLRAQLLGASKVLEQATDDEYLFIREAYLQRRRSLIGRGDSGAQAPQ